MTLTGFLIMILFGVTPCFFLWAFIHEMAHVLTAMWLVGVKTWKIHLLPQRNEYGFTFAHCKWTWESPPTNLESGLISIAPRVPNIIACFAFMFFSFFSFPFNYLWFLIWGSGLIDMIWGSWGISETSDLRKASKYLGISPWTFRILGFSCIFISVIAGFSLMFAN